MTKLVLALAVIASSTASTADSDVPVSYDLWFDALLEPHPANPRLDNLVEGDSVTIHVDTTRLFPLEKIGAFDLAFRPDAAPPETHGFYIAGTGFGTKNPFFVEPVSCGIQAKDQAIKDASAAVTAAQAALAKLAQDSADRPNALKALDDATKARDAALKDRDGFRVDLDSGADRCGRAPDWTPKDDKLVPLLCNEDQTIGNAIDHSASWSLVQRDGDKYECVAEWNLQKAAAISSVSVAVTNGQSAADPIAAVAEKGIWTAAITIKSNTRRLALKTVNTNKEEQPLSIDVHSSARDTHSQVRVQAEILAANRLRAVSFAVAVTPVSRKFFTEGPWHWDCVAGCTLAPTVLLRISGDDKTIVQFGIGAGLNLVRAFQLNGGLLFGSTDANSAWRVDRSWFVGLAIDPLILSEVISTAGKKE